MDVEYLMTLLGSRVMAENQEIDLNAWQKLDLLQDEARNEGMRAIHYFLISYNKCKAIHIYE